MNLEETIVESLRPALLALPGSHARAPTGNVQHDKTLDLRQFQHDIIDRHLK